MAVGMACVLTAVLLWWAAGRAPQAEVLALSAERPPGDAFTAERQGDVFATWTSTETVTKVILYRQYVVWPISQYGVTITFYGNSLNGDATFEFTPRIDLVLQPPFIATPYIFELRGISHATGKPASLLNDIDIVMEYDEANLGGIRESSLGVYSYWPIAGGEDWVSQSSSVDTINNRIHFATTETRVFVVGGFRSRVFLPVSHHEAWAQSTVASEDAESP
jgi:hypothetical protein